MGYISRTHSCSRGSSNNLALTPCTVRTRQSHSLTKPTGPDETACFSQLCRTRPGPHQSSLKRTCTHPISIKGSPKVVLSCFHGFHQVSSIGEVGVRVVASEVLQRNTVNCRVCGGTQFFAEDLLHVWSNDYVKCEMKNQKL